MVGCSILGCKSRSERNINGITFHSFPTTEKVKKIWIDATGRTNWKPSKYARVCSIHFNTNSIIHKNKIVDLKKNCIPKHQIRSIMDGKKLFKCDACIWTYSNQAALEHHKETMHPYILKLPLPEGSGIAGEHRNKNVINQKKEDKPETAKESTIFRCTKCPKTFPSEFVVEKHMCVYHTKEKDSQTPRQMIELICKQEPKDIPHDNCVKENPNTIFVCSGCNAEFISMLLFDRHIQKSHSTKVECFYFKSRTDFVNFKDSIEKSHNIMYRMNNECDDKIYYHCACQIYLGNNRINCCPSVMVAQIFNGAYQVYFYHQHFRHSFTAFKVPNLYKKCCITHLVKPSDGFQSLENDPYLLFKTLMDNIVVEAARINVNRLKEIIAKALEMTSVLNEYDDDEMDSKSTEKKYLTDKEISDVLQSTSVLMKRNLAKDTEPGAKKCKTGGNDAPDVVNVFSLARHTQISSSDTDTCDEENDIDDIILMSNNTTKNISTAGVTYDITDKSKEKDAPSFNDTYKDFVTKNFTEPKLLAPPSRMRNQKRWKNSNADIPHTPTISVDRNSLGNTNCSKSINNTTAKPIASETPVIKVRNDIIKTPEKLKTEDIPQEPRDKRLDLNKTQNEPVLLKVTSEPLKKIDFEYEVIEQESDCNILVLRVT